MTSPSLDSVLAKRHGHSASTHNRHVFASTQAITYTVNVFLCLEKQITLGKYFGFIGLKKRIWNFYVI